LGSFVATFRDERSFPALAFYRVSSGLIIGTLFLWIFSVIRIIPGVLLRGLHLLAFLPAEGPVRRGFPLVILTPFRFRFSTRCDSPTRAVVTRLAAFLPLLFPPSAAARRRRSRPPSHSVVSPPKGEFSPFFFWCVPFLQSQCASNGTGIRVFLFVLFVFPSLFGRRPFLTVRSEVSRLLWASFTRNLSHFPCFLFSC